jgi:hypothetical protein
MLVVPTKNLIFSNFSDILNRDLKKASTMRCRGQVDYDSAYFPDVRRHCGSNGWGTGKWKENKTRQPRMNLGYKEPTVARRTESVDQESRVQLEEKKRQESIKKEQEDIEHKRRNYPESSQKRIRTYERLPLQSHRQSSPALVWKWSVRVLGNGLSISSCQEGSPGTYSQVWRRGGCMLCRFEIVL